MTKTSYFDHQTDITVEFTWKNGTECIYTLKTTKKKQENLGSPYFNLPKHTCNTTVWVRGVPKSNAVPVPMTSFWKNHGFTCTFMNRE